MNPLQRLRNWTMRLPNVWGLGQAEIHSSLFIMLGILSTLVTILSLSRPGFEELLPAALTLPVVWVLSLAVRVAAQQLALGENAYDMETIVGPSGNLATDYEYLPGKRMLGYSLAGQLATFGLMLLGFVVNAAMTQAEPARVSIAEMLDLKGGWQSQAWASQIMWINLFLGLLHCLPTVPFDMRATLFSLYSWRHRNAQEPLVFRKVARVVSHLSTFMLSMGLTALVLGWMFQREIVGWYGAIAAAVYLFVAAQWESSRAEDLEEQYTLLPPHRYRAKATAGGGYASAAEAAAASQHAASVLPPAGELGTSGLLSDLDGVASPEGGPEDIDEILRKLHREGRDALSPQEQQALLVASRVLKERRGQTS